MANLTSIQIAQIDFIQKNFRKLRSICEWSASDVAEIMGVTRQTINNIELGKTLLSPLQYIGFSAMLEYCRKTRPQIAAHLDIYLMHFPKSEQVAGANLLAEWFASFPKQFPETSSLKDALRNVQSVDLIEHIVGRCKVFVTPDIFQGNRKCLEELGTVALRYENPLIVPAKALSQIMPSLNEDCRDFVTACRCDGRIRFYGSERDASLAEVITTQILRLRAKYPLCLVTGDQVLAADVQTLGRLQSVPGYDILTARIVNDTYLELWDDSTGDWEGLLSSGEACAPSSPEEGDPADKGGDAPVFSVSLQDTSDAALPGALNAGCQRHEKYPCPR